MMLIIYIHKIRKNKFIIDTSFLTNFFIIIVLGKFRNEQKEI